MNSVERITAAVQLETYDRVPVIAQVFGHAAVLDGEDLRDYVQDGELLAKCQIRALERYGYDAVFALMDVNVETEAVGSRLNYRSGLYPTVDSYIVSEGTDIADLALPDPHRDGRMPELVKAGRLLRREVGHDVLVVGCVVGPLTLALQLMGAEKAMYLAIDHPDRFAELMDYATEVAIRFGEAQIEAGTHLPIVFNPAASPAMVPSQFFREFELPRLKRVFSRFAQAGAAAHWLHVAGPTQPILSLYPDAGVTIANFDYCVTASEALEQLPHTCIDGNIRPLAFVDATPDEIVAESSALLQAFAPRGGFILSSGCEIPPESSPDNIAAMVSAAREHN